MSDIESLRILDVKNLLPWTTFYAIFFSPRIFDDLFNCYLNKNKKFKKLL